MSTTVYILCVRVKHRMSTVVDFSALRVKTQNVYCSRHQCSKVKHRMSTVVDISALRVKHRMSTVVAISALRVKHRMSTVVDISALRVKTQNVYSSRHQCSKG